MATFTYEAITRTGTRIEGERNAENSEEVARYLYSQDLTVISIFEKVDFSFKKLSSIEIGGIGLTEKVLLTSQLSTMVTSGIPIIQAIDILVQQSSKANIKTKLQKVYKSIESGSSLSQAFQKEGGIFSEVQINLLAAGEKSGNLNEMLLKIAEDMQKSKALRGKITGALIYPAIIFVVLIVVLFVMIVFMVPQIRNLYETLGQEDLPFITEVLVSIGGILSNPFTLMLTLFVVFSFVIGFRMYNNTKGGRLLVDRLKLKIPVFGNLIAKIQLTEFCRLTSMLLVSGVPIIDSIEIVARALGNRTFTEVLMLAKEDIKKGSTLSIALAKNNVKSAFPIILLKIIATGEESGKMDKVLNDMSKYYENEVDQIAGNLTKLLEPFILVIVGGMVAFLAIAIYLPIYQVGNYIQQ